jgi:hypothetical protein
MPLISITKSYQDGDILTEQDLDNIRNDVISFLNVTQLDASNIQSASITTALIQDQAVTTAKIDDNAVTEAKIALSLRYGPIGTIISFHSFNGLLTLPRGFMKMNGDVVSQANYDAIHGAGAYVTDGIASSALLTRNLPNANSKYLTGSATTTQDGTVAITYVGNSGNTINIQHDHTVDSHNHVWWDFVSGEDDQTYDSDGNTFEVDVDMGANGADAADTGLRLVQKNEGVHLGVNGYTSNQTPGTDNQLSTTQSIRPHSVEVMMLIKVI